MWCSFSSTENLCNGHKGPEFEGSQERGAKMVRNTAGNKAWKWGYGEVQNMVVFVGGTHGWGTSVLQNSIEIHKLMSK